MYVIIQIKIIIKDLNYYDVKKALLKGIRRIRKRGKLVMNQVKKEKVFGIIVY